MEQSSVIFSQGKSGLPKIEIHTESSDAEIYLQGAHVTKFQRKGEPPLLFLSAKSRFEKGHPIRGGVPIIFPWFGAREGKQMHGFARNETWELKEVSQATSGVTLKLSLPDSPEAVGFPKFSAEYFVTVGETLSLELKIANCSNEDFSFENCLHTYFSIGEISAVSVVGLKGTEYLDKVGNFACKKRTAKKLNSLAKPTAFIWTRRVRSKFTIQNCSAASWLKKKARVQPWFGIRGLRKQKQWPILVTRNICEWFVWNREMFRKIRLCSRREKFLR